VALSLLDGSAQVAPVAAASTTQSSPNLAAAPAAQGQPAQAARPTEETTT